MIRNGLIILLGSGLLACDTNDAAVIVQGVALAEVDAMTGACSFTADQDTANYRLSSDLDTAASYNLTLPFVTKNNLAEVTTDVGDMSEMIASEIGNIVSPVRYSVQWECDNTAFSGGAFIVPHFDVENGFCYDQRTGQTPSSFFGFDVVAASGTPIPPQELGIMRANVIPPEFGQHIDDAIQLATLADQCCEDSRATNCDGTGGSASCTELLRRFSILDRNGDLGLQVESDEPGEPSADILRFQPFSVFDGQHVVNSRKAGFDNAGFGTMYTLRQRGVFETVTTDGQTIQSSQTTHTVNIGRNTGPFTTDVLACQGSGHPNAPCRPAYFEPCYNNQ